MWQTFSQLGFPGRLIAVEGVDGVGKSTQVYLLRRWLQKQGLKVISSEWDSGDLIRRTASQAQTRQLLTPTTYCLLNATEFADRYERQYVPFLRAGYLVLCDRYFFTALARDRVRGCPEPWVRKIYQFAALPDLVFFLQTDLNIATDRVLANRRRLRYFEAGMDLGMSMDRSENFRAYQARLLDQYLQMGSEFQFCIIDGGQSIERQQSLLQGLVKHHIQLSNHVSAHQPQFRQSSS